MSNNQDSSSLHEALTALQGTGALAKIESQFLADVTEEEVRRRMSRKAQVDSLVEEFLKDKIDLDACLLELQRIQGHAISTTSPTLRRVAENLAQKEVLHRTQTGYQFREPFWPFLYKIIPSPAGLSRWEWLDPVNR